MDFNNFIIDNTIQDIDKKIKSGHLNINDTDSDGNNILSALFANDDSIGYYEMNLSPDEDEYKKFNFILSLGLKINQQNNEGNTLLHNLMMLEDAYEYINICLKYAPDINIENSYGHTPFLYACLYNQNLVEDLIDNVDDINRKFSFSIDDEYLLATSFEFLMNSSEQPLSYSLIKAFIDNGFDPLLPADNGIAFIDDIHPSRQEKQILSNILLEKKHNLNNRNKNKIL